MTPDYAWIHREGRKKRYENKRVGGTIVVHFIKKNMWFLETAQALLGGDEQSEAEIIHRREAEKKAEEAVALWKTPLDALEITRSLQAHRRR